MNHSSNETGLAPRTNAPVIAGVVLLALCAAMFWWTGRWMISRWEFKGGYYSHGWLVPVVTGYLLWRKRAALAACPLQPYRRGLLLLVPALLIQVVAAEWQIGFLQGIALLLVLAGLVLTLLGPRLFRLAFFPLVFLAFMVPVPEATITTLSLNMKLLSAGVATNVAEVFGLVTVREGSIIHIPNGTLVVDDVCSGLKYLIALMAFSALYAHLSSVKTWQKWTLFLLSVPISFLANVGRVTLMVAVASRWGVPMVENKYIHDVFGFVLFAVAFVCLFVIESFMLMKVPWLRVGKSEPARAAEPEPPPCLPAGKAGSAVAPPAATPLAPRPPYRAGPLGAGVMCAMAAVAALSLYVGWQRDVRPPSDILAGIPLSLGDWKGTDYKLDEHVFEILGTRDVLSREYVNSKRQRVSFLIVLALQTRSRTHQPEQCLSGEGYKIVSDTDRTVTLPSGGGPRTFAVRELQLSHAGGGRVSWYFYKSGEHLNTSYWKHQLGIAWRKFTDPLAADALIRAEADADPADPEHGQKVLQDFFNVAAPYILTKLP